MNTQLLNFESKKICKKLEKLFYKKKKALDKKHNVSGSYDFTNLEKSDKEWTNYLDKFGISTVGIKDALKYLNSKKEYICVENSASSCSWNYGRVKNTEQLRYLMCDANDRYVNKIVKEYWFVVPREFAEKALILESLP